MKDLQYTEKEITAQLQRIQMTKDSPEKDEYDVKKQHEVLTEYEESKPREQEALKKGYLVLLEAVELAEGPDADEAIALTEEFTAAQQALKDASPILLACEKIDSNETYPPPAAAPMEDFDPDE